MDPDSVEASVVLVPVVAVDGDLDQWEELFRVGCRVHIEGLDGVFATVNRIRVVSQQTRVGLVNAAKRNVKQLVKQVRIGFANTSCGKTALKLVLCRWPGWFEWPG